MTDARPTAGSGGLKTLRNLLCHVREELQANLKPFEVRKDELNGLFDVITLLWREPTGGPRLQKEDRPGDTGQEVSLVAIRGFHALRTLPKNLLERLIPLIREMAIVGVVFEVQVRVADHQSETITRIHWERRFGRIALATHTARS